MKDKTFQIRVDDEFLSKLECLKEINNYKNNSDTVIKTIEKDFNKEIVYQKIREEFIDRICKKFDQDSVISIVLKNAMIDVLKEYQ